MRSHEDEGTGSVNYWPAMLDMLAATLMVFVLATYLQSVLAVNSPEMLDLQKRKESFIAALSESMHDELTRGELDFNISPESILIRFSDRVLFDTGEYQLKESGQALLDRFGKLLVKTIQGGSVQRIQVEGHTDDTPIRPRKTYPTNNWELSSARATSVVSFLSRNNTLVREDLFSANGFASFRPVVRDGTPEGRARNRRVEIRLIFSTNPVRRALPATAP